MPISILTVNRNTASSTHNLLTEIEKYKLRLQQFKTYHIKDHIIWKNLLLQYGAPLFSADHKKVLWNTTQAGYDAWAWFTGLTTKDKVSQPNFNDSAYAAFYTKTV